MHLSSLILGLVLVSLPAQEADELWRSGARAAAIERALEELAAKPDDTALRRTLVEWELAVHRYKAALEHLAPLPADADRLRGEAHYRAGEYEAALRYLDEAVPEQRLMKVDALETLQRFDESDATLARALAALGREDPRLLAAEGRRLAREGKHLEAAAAFRAALAKDALDGEALFGLGRALVQAGERGEGMKVLERHRALTPLFDQWDFARRGVDLAPQHAPNLTGLGDAERALGRLDRAEQAYRDAAELATAEQLVPNALRHARLLVEDRKDLHAAIALLRATAERAPDVRILVRTGDLLRESGETTQAIAAYERALTSRPSDAEIRKRLEAARADASKAAR